MTNQVLCCKYYMKLCESNFNICIITTTLANSLTNVQIEKNT